MSNRLILTATPLFLFWTAAYGQKYEIAPIAAYQRTSREPLGSISSVEPRDDDTKFRDGAGIGLRLTWNTKGYYGHEIGYLVSRFKLESKVRAEETAAVTVLRDRVVVQQAFYNFIMYMMPAGERWRPFITGGAQGYQYGAPKFADWPTGATRNWGVNWGGGLKLKLMKHALVRFDLRDYIGGKPYDLTFQESGTGIETKSQAGGFIHQIEGSVGIAITF